MLLLTALNGTGIAERVAAGDVSGSGMDPNSTADPSTGPDPVLSGSAIANITGSAAAILIICSVMCYLGLVYNKQERMLHVRTALERNRQIDRQIAAAKARQQQKAGDDGEKEGKEEGAPPPGDDDPLLFSAVHTSHKQVDTDEEQPLVSYRQPGDSRWDHGSTGATTTITIPIETAQDTANLTK